MLAVVVLITVAIVGTTVIVSWREEPIAYQMLIRKL
jgi:hypothetical protein